MDYRKYPYGMNSNFLGIQSLSPPYNKIPFYMTYTQMNTYQEEVEYERDMDKMKQMFPEQAQKIQKYVEEECDKMEYEGSQMFDEYPDQVSMRAIAKRISDKIEAQSIKEQSMEEQTIEEKTLEAQVRTQMAPPPWGRRPGPPPPWHDRPGPPPPPRPYPPRGDFVRDLVEVMLFNEVYKRRCRYHRCRRWW